MFKRYIPKIYNLHKSSIKFVPHITKTYIQTFCWITTFPLPRSTASSRQIHNKASLHISSNPQAPTIFKHRAKHPMVVVLVCDTYAFVCFWMRQLVSETANIERDVVLGGPFEYIYFQVLICVFGGHIEWPQLVALSQTSQRSGRAGINGQSLKACCGGWHFWNVHISAVGVYR